MSKKIPTSTTKEFLKSIAIPNHGGRYTPISHESIIEGSILELANNDLPIKAELYRSTIRGNVANGIILIDHGSDTDLKMVLAWGNSYDKSTRFTCGIGVYVMSTKTFMFAGNLSHFARKHTGKADAEAMENIKQQVANANAYYDILVDTKNKLSNLELSQRQIAEMIGRLFIENQALTKEQVGGIYDMLKTKQVLFDNTDHFNAWNIYNIIAKYLRESHPKIWIQSQCAVHKYFVNEFIDKPVVAQENVVETTDVVVDDTPTNQLSLLDAISEAEQEMRQEEQEPAKEEIEMPLQEDEKSLEVTEEFVNFDSDDDSFELPEL